MAHNSVGKIFIDKLFAAKIFAVWDKCAKILSCENFTTILHTNGRASWAVQYHMHCSIYTSSKWNFLRCCSQVLRWYILHFSTFNGPFRLPVSNITPRWWKNWIITTFIVHRTFSGLFEITSEQYHSTVVKTLALVTKCYCLAIDQQHVLPFSSSGWIQSDRKEQQKTSPKCRSSLQGDNGKASVLTV